MEVVAESPAESLPSEESDGAAHGVLVGALLGSAVWAATILLAVAWGVR